MNPEHRELSLQDRRSLETRESLKTATLTALVDLGYHATTVGEIAKRAGVSRGALTYHYQTKSALVLDATLQCLRERHEELRQAVARLPDTHEHSLTQAIELLWTLYDGWAFPAWIEVVAASRTDPELRRCLHEKMDPWVQDVMASLAAWSPAIARNAIFQDGRFLFSVLDGIALSRMLYPDERGPESLLFILKKLARQLYSTATPSTLEKEFPA